MDVDVVALGARSTDGSVTLGFAGGPDAVRVALIADEGSIRAERLVGPDGPVWDAADWLGPERLTLAAFDGPGDVVFGWPVRASDPALSEGDWTLELTVSGPDGAPLDGVDVVGELVAKADPDLRRGTLAATIVVPTGLADGLTGELERATRRWARALRRAGVVLAVTRIDADVPILAPDPRSGDPALGATADLAPDAELVVWLAEDLASGDVGAAGAIPGAAHGALRAVLGVAVGRVAGVDGTLDQADADALGDVLAHETGHHLGLFHVVEPTFDVWDALDDTAACGDRATCEQRLGRNVMFPYVCDGCDADRWTGGQVGVVQRAVAVR